MKIYFLLLFAFTTQLIFAQDYYTEFITALQDEDESKQIQILEKWASENEDSPEYYIAKFNFHFNKSRNEVLTITTDELQGENLLIKDSLGTTVGSMGSKIYFDDDEIKLAFKYISKGISLYPTRLDLRFGKISALRNFQDWDGFTDEIIKTINSANTKKSPWLWADNVKKEGDNDFMIACIQDYQIQLYETQDDALLINMRRIAESILNYYPNHIESLSNLSITYMILGEYDKALKPLLKAESIAPDDHIIIANIANAYKLKKDNNKSIAYYEKLLKFEDIDGVADFAKEQLALIKSN